MSQLVFYLPSVTPSVEETEMDAMSRWTRAITEPHSVLMIKLMVAKFTGNFFLCIAGKCLLGLWHQRRLDFLYLRDYANDISGSCELLRLAGESLVISSSADAALKGRFPKHTKCQSFNLFSRAISQNVLLTVVGWLLLWVLKFSVQVAKQRCFLNDG